MTWRNCNLGDVLTLKRGHDLPGDSRIDGDVPVVSSSGITGYHNEAKAQAPGVVTGRYGTIGEVFYLDQAYWPLNTSLYVIDFKGTHPKFAAYFLRNVLRNYQSEKAAVPGVDRNVLITDIVPDHIDWSSVPYCLIEDERLERFRLREGDIVIARTGATVGYAKRSRTTLCRASEVLLSRMQTHRCWLPPRS